MASSNKCHATRNKCLTSSKQCLLLETSALLDGLLLLLLLRGHIRGIVRPIQASETERHTRPGSERVGFSRQWRSFTVVLCPRGIRLFGVRLRRSPMEKLCSFNRSDLFGYSHRSSKEHVARLVWECGVHATKARNICGSMHRGHPWFERGPGLGHSPHVLTCETM